MLNTAFLYIFSSKDTGVLLLPSVTGLCFLTFQVGAGISPSWIVDESYKVCLLYSKEKRMEMCVAIFSLLCGNFISYLGTEIKRQWTILSLHYFLQWELLFRDPSIGAGNISIFVCEEQMCPLPTPGKRHAKYFITMRRSPFVKGAWLQALWLNLARHVGETLFLKGRMSLKHMKKL